jgi:hypothetical protein
MFTWGESIWEAMPSPKYWGFVSSSRKTAKSGAVERREPIALASSELFRGTGPEKQFVIIRKMSKLISIQNIIIVAFKILF